MAWIGVWLSRKKKVQGAEVEGGPRADAEVGRQEKEKAGNWERHAGKRRSVEERISGECASTQGMVTSRREGEPHSLFIFFSFSLSLRYPLSSTLTSEWYVHCPSDDKGQWRATETFMLTRPFEMNSD